MAIRGNLLGRFLDGSVRLEFRHFSLHTIQVVWKVSAFQFRHLLVDPFQQIGDQPFVVILHSLILQQSSYHLIDTCDTVKSKYSLANFLLLLYLFGNRSHIHYTGTTIVSFSINRRKKKEFTNKMCPKYALQILQPKKPQKSFFHTCMMSH